MEPVVVEMGGGGGGGSMAGRQGLGERAGERKREERDKKKKGGGSWKFLLFPYNPINTSLHQKNKKKIIWGVFFIFIYFIFVGVLLLVNIR